MKDVYVVVETRIILRVEDAADPETVVNSFVSEMDYDFVSKTPGLVVIDTKIRDNHITKVEIVPDPPSPPLPLPPASAPPPEKPS